MENKNINNNSINYLQVIDTISFEDFKKMYKTLTKDKLIEILWNLNVVYDIQNLKEKEYIYDGEKKEWVRSSTIKPVEWETFTSSDGTEDSEKIIFFYRINHSGK